MTKIIVDKNEVKKIVQEFRKEVKLGRKAVIMLDKSDGEIWLDVFESNNDSWKRYKSDTIIRLMSEDFEDTDKIINVENVMKVIEKHLNK